MQAVLQGVNPAYLQYLILIIRREELLLDALAQIGGKTKEDLKKPLKVIFTSGDVREEGIDSGGVTKASRTFDPL